ncbi:MAG: hypothetical protein IKQ31_02030 [Clostridia bacterium]|nr:hypothetical protein [Clostridia bacterium]
MGTYTLNQYLELTDSNVSYKQKKIEELKAIIPSKEKLASAKKGCIYRVAGTATISSITWITLTVILDSHINDLSSAFLQVSPIGLGFLAISTLVASAPYYALRHEYKFISQKIQKLENELSETKTH